MAVWYFRLDARGFQRPIASYSETSAYPPQLSKEWEQRSRAPCFRTGVSNDNSALLRHPCLVAGAPAQRIVEGPGLFGQRIELLPAPFAHHRVALFGR